MVSYFFFQKTIKDCQNDLSNNYIKLSKLSLINACDVIDLDRLVSMKRFNQSGVALGCRGSLIHFINRHIFYYG